jgi:hypothetical protein
VLVIKSALDLDNEISLKIANDEEIWKQKKAGRGTVYTFVTDMYIRTIFRRPLSYVCTYWSHFLYSSFIRGKSLSAIDKLSKKNKRVYP